MKKNPSRLVFWHILGCVTFLILPVILSPRPPHMPVFSRLTLRDMLANFLMLIIFYLNYYVFIPKLYFRSKNISYGLLILLGFIAIVLLPGILTGNLPWSPKPPPPFGLRGPIPMNDDFSFLNPVRHGLFLYIAVTLFSILLRVRMKLQNAESLRLNAEVGTLKNQINPHFLFNTLNNIYAFAIREKSPNTASSILKLSAMMRYVVTETSQEFVPLIKEINYTNDYIDLQKMRLTETVNLSYAVTGNIKEQKIAPVILMPFIENAFKHGVNPDKPSTINIRIDIDHRSLELNVENQKVKLTQEIHTQSGVGIENTTARLEHFYPKKHILSIHDSNDYYRVTLKLELT
jgi:hypothetical protein